MPLQSVNPATGEALRSFPTMDDETLQKRIAQAHGAAAELRTLPLEHRLLCLRKLASLLEEDSTDLARTVTQETGKPIRQSVAEIALCAETCRYHADHTARLLAPELIATEAGQAYVQWSPMGVILAVMPGESPFWQTFRFLIPALAGGNAVLLKQASGVPQCSLAMEALVRRSGFSRGVLTVLLAEDRLVEAALADGRVAAVTVNGNESTGRALATKAGWMLKKSTLHLNGSDPMVVMPSANIEKAIEAAIRSLTGESSVHRMVVHTGVCNDFLLRLSQRAEALRIGDPQRDDTEVGPLHTAEAASLLEDQVKAAVAAGGRIVSGGARLIGRGFFFEPTILSDVPRNSAVARDALSGPVCIVFRARDLGEAIAIANDTPFGRAASVWTEEPGEQQPLIASVDAGFVALNALPSHDPRLPVGGAKGSGYGRELGTQGIREFQVAKTVSIGA